MGAQVPKHALVVDDSATMRLLVADSLQQVGFSVTVAENGSRGVELLDSGPFQLIVTDLNMPIMDGLKFLAHVRNHTSHKYAPVLMLTAESSQNRIAAARTAGATAWLVKPFNREKLLGVVARVVR